MLGYSQQGGEYTIHVWRLCGQGQPAKHLCSFPLAEKEATADGDFLPADEGEASVMLVTMCELAEGDTLGALLATPPLTLRGLSISTLTPLRCRPPVIHAVPFTDASGDGDRENVANTGQQPGPSHAAAPEQRRAFVCVVPSPWSVPAAQRSVTSAYMFTYLTSAPSSSFDAGLCIQGRRLYLPTGDGLTVVELAPPALVPCIVNTTLVWGGSLKGGCPSALVTFDPWAVVHCAPADDNQWPRFGVKPALRGRLEAEEHIARALAAPLAGGYRLVDYAVHLVDTVHVAPGQAGSSHLAALLLCVAALRSSKSLDAQHVHPVALLSGLFVTHQPRATAEEESTQPPPLRPSITCRLLHSVEMQACSADLLARLAAGQAAALRRTCRIPQAAHAQPHVVDNMSAIQRWVSAPVLRHPTLPIAVLGFGVRAQG